MKRCSKCGVEKALDQFPQSKGVINAWCKACHRARSRERYAPHPKHKVAGPDGLRECSKCKARKPPAEFYTDKRAHDGLKHQCKRCHEGYTKTWCERNPEKRAEINRKSMRSENHVKATKRWRVANKERMYALRKQWIEKNKERFLPILRELKRKWKKEHPECVAVANANRRARKRGASGSYTEADIKTLYIKQRGKCAHPWCHTSLENGYHRDHIVALASGGSNFIENIQLLCPLCNTSKATKDPIKLMQERGFLI